MAFLTRFSIRRKIITIILLVTLISLVAGFSTEIISSIISSRKELVNNITLDSRLISGFSIPTLLFDDPEEAGKILSTLNNIPSVVFGAIFDNNNNLFASYSKSSSDSSLIINRPDTSVIFKDKFLYITEPVISENEKIGEVLLVASTKIIKELVLNHTKKILVIFFLSSLIAILLAITLQRFVSGPIVELASVTRNISSSHDLSLRVQKKFEDETGMLIDSFNDLIISLEKRKEERDQAEKELMEERVNLERRVEERTRELNTAKEKAEESDRLKTAFISNFSHEIRTPLNAIMGFTELLSEGLASSVEKKFALECITQSKDDLIQLVENILDTSSIETRQFYLNKSEFIVNKEIEKLASHTRDLLIRKEKENIEFRLSIESTSRIKIHTDGPRIIQVLKQLIDNAVKYTDSGIVELGSFTSGLSEVGFYVKDSGCGIPEHEKEKVFTRFYKINSSKNTLYRGAGLGLTLVKGIVTSLDGKIWIESKPDSGTGIFFTIPCAITIIEKDVKREAQLNFKAILSGKRILVAEDNMANYQYILEVFKRNNLECVHAKNGLEAVEKFITGRNFDLILMDILMPEMDGIEASRKIKNEVPDIPIIAVTAFDYSKEDKETIKNFDGFLQKPILPDILLKAISDVLTRKAK